jgi:hypothetical protein
LSQGHAI